MRRTASISSELSSTNLMRDTSVESHPFDCAQGRLLRKERARMGHPALEWGDTALKQGDAALIDEQETGLM